MRVYFALALGLVAGFALAGLQKVSVPTKTAQIPEKLTAQKLRGKSVAETDEAFGAKGEITGKDFKTPAPGVKLASVYWEKEKVWSVTYELDPKKELGADWWKDAMRAVGLDPTKGKMNPESEDELKMIDEYPGLPGEITIEQYEDEETGEKVVTVDWEDDSE